MSRELNGSLFGQIPTPSVASDMGHRTSPTERITDQSQKIEQSQKDLVVKELIEEVRALKRKVREVENRSKATESRLNSLASTSKTHMERVQGVCQRLDSNIKSTTQEMASRLSLLSGKMTEQRVSDTKIQALIDRHNSVVQSFEQRVAQLQKVISEQEMKILNYHSTLEEIRREFSRQRTR